jgi:hypothetical protein
MILFMMRVPFLGCYKPRADESQLRILVHAEVRDVSSVGCLQDYSFGTLPYRAAGSQGRRTPVTEPRYRAKGVVSGLWQPDVGIPTRHVAAGKQSADLGRGTSLAQSIGGHSHLPMSDTVQSHFRCKRPYGVGLCPVIRIGSTVYLPLWLPWRTRGQGGDKGFLGGAE